MGRLFVLLGDIVSLGTMADMDVICFGEVHFLMHQIGQAVTRVTPNLPVLCGNHVHQTKVAFPLVLRFVLVVDQPSRGHNSILIRGFM